MKRHSLSRGKSRKMFRKTASVDHVHQKNFIGMSGPMRGGIRL